LDFYRKINPGGPGWKKVLADARRAGENVGPLADDKWDVPSGLLAVFFGLAMIYSALFALGFWLYSNAMAAVISTSVAVISAGLLFKFSRNFRLH
jgi:hypothetical protein